MSLQQEFAQQFSPLNETLIDSYATFSGSKMYADLTALEPLAQTIGPNSSELLQLYNALSLLQKKRGEIDEQISYSKAAVKIQMLTGGLPLHDYVLLLNRLIEGLQEEEAWDDALIYSDLLVELIDQDAELDNSQKLYLKQKRGYLLHEAGRYVDALELNLSILNQAEKEFGKDASELYSLLTNIAQNFYELDEFDKAEEFLTRNLKLAEEHEDEDQQFEMLFQLGVLAFESDEPEQARAIFNQYTELADKLDDDYYREKAQDLMSELEERIAAQA